MKNERMEKEREFSYWLCNIEGIGRITVLRLIREAGSAEKVYGMEEKALAGMLRPSQLMNFLKARQEKENIRSFGQEESVSSLFLIRSIRAGFLPFRIRRWESMSGVNSRKRRSRRRP